MRGQAFIAATALVTALAGLVQPAAAQQYPTYHDQHVANQQTCAQSRNNRTVGGALIGAAAGALLGREVADRGVRSEGTLLGAVVGATAGGMIGRNSARCATVPQGSYDPYSGRPYGQQSAPYYGDNSGLEGGPYRESSYYGEPRRAADCRMGQVITRDPYGREVYEDVEMCRGSDGVWRTRY